jgi:hypothetical protein
MRLEHFFYALAHMFGDEPMRAGPPNGMHPGYPHSIPGVLGGLPSWGAHSYNQYHPAPPVFGMGVPPAPGGWAPGGYGPGAHAPWTGQPGTLPHRFETRPPPATYRHQPAQSMPGQAPVGVPHVHPDSHHGTQGMRSEPLRTVVETEPAPHGSQRAQAIVRDFRPPQNEREETEQLGRAIEQSLVESRLSSFRKREEEKQVDRAIQQSRLESGPPSAGAPSAYSRHDRYA